MSLREFNVTAALYGYRARLGGVQWLRDGGRGERKGSANWTARIFTGHKGWPSLRRKLYRTRGHQGTAPRTLLVAFNPLSRPFASPISTYLWPSRSPLGVPGATDTPTVKLPRIETDPLIPSNDGGGERELRG